MEIIEKTNKQELLEAIALKIEQGYAVRGYSAYSVGNRIVYSVFMLNPSLL